MKNRDKEQKDEKKMEDLQINDYTKCKCCKYVIKRQMGREEKSRD